LAAETHEVSDMNEQEQLNQLYALLGVSTFAAATTAINGFNAFFGEAKALTGESSTDKVLASAKDACAFRGRIEKATNKAGDEAHGVVLAALESHKELPGLRAQVAELQAKTTQQELDTMLAKAIDDKKLTPAQEQNYRDQVASGDLTLKGCKSVLDSLHPIPALQNVAPPATSQDAGSVQGAADEPMKHNGKTWSDMAPSERAALKRSDLATYNAMRIQALAK
jgi:phage I-like protein